MKRIGVIWLCLLVAAGLAHAQRAPLAEEVFKNVQVLKGIPVDEFMSTMGVFSAALGMSCEDCHAANDSKWENYALDTSPRKRTARRMVEMMAAINKTYFAGQRRVTCYSCHRGNDAPRATVSLAAVYGGSPDEDDHEIVKQAPDAPKPEQIFERYIRAAAGNGLTSFVARGTSSGYGPESEKRPIEIYAKAPAERTTIIHTSNGDSTTAFDGRSGWIGAPLRPTPVMQLTGGELEGARLDAELAFPLKIAGFLTQWRVGRQSTVNGRKMDVVQGTGAAGAILATFYFDTETGLLARQERYANSVVGRVPTQIEYSDYREVAGAKLPFRWTVTWLDGRETVELNEIRPNVAIDESRFAKPAR
jgi:outer membrane lipoprotein-sorting protein